MENQAIQIIKDMESLYSSLIAMGGPGVVIVAVLVVFQKMTKNHKEERLDWQKSNVEIQNKFIEAIKENTRVLTQVSERIK